MKILVLDNENPFEVSSASANRWRTLIDGLADEGAQVHVVVVQGYQTTGEIRKNKNNNTTQRLHFYYSIFLLHSTVWWSRASIYILGPLFHKLNILRTKKIIEKVDPDVVFLHPSTEVFSIFKAIYEGKKRKFKLMVEIGEFNDIHITEKTSRNKKQLERANRYNSLLTGYILPEVDILLAITQRLVEHYKKIAANPKADFVHLPMTVDLKRFSQQIASPYKKPYLAYIGVLNNSKDGIDILIKAFKKVYVTFEDISLLLVGAEHPDTPGQKELVKELGLEGRVLFTGSVNRDAVPAILMNAEALMLPRPDSHQAQGGFPTKLGEYLATGNPVCITKVGEIPDYLEDNVSAFMATPGDVDSFADALSRALSDKSKALEVGLNGKKVAHAKFNMEIQAHKLYELLQQKIK